MSVLSVLQPNKPVLKFVLFYLFFLRLRTRSDFYKAIILIIYIIIIIFVHLKKDCF